MKLIFSKNDKQEITVFNKKAEQLSEFSYVDMVRSLIATKSLEVPEIGDDFSDLEKESILSMVKHINDEVAEFYSETEDNV